MPRNSEQEQLAALGARLTREAKKILGPKKAGPFLPFLACYYADVALQDIENEKTENLIGAAYAHYQFAAKREKGKPIVRVYNPTHKEYGWSQPRTVIEVVNDDMPFLVDSTTSTLNQLKLVVHLVIHPIYRCVRDSSGKLTRIAARGDGDGDGSSESFMRFEVNEQPKEQLVDIRKRVETVLRDIRSSVDDWGQMRTKMRKIIDELEVHPAELPVEEVGEVRDFLRWIHDNHYTFLGFREYEFKGGGKEQKVVPVKGSGLGILNDPSREEFSELSRLAALPKRPKASASEPHDLLTIAKTDALATVHRPAHMDVIGIKRLDAKGNIIGQRMFVGLFTSSAYSLNPKDIPVLRRKLQNALVRAAYPTASHAGKALQNILETFPRDELFQVSEDHLLETSVGILRLQDRQRVALFIRRDDFERFISCLVYVPRDRYTTALRESMQGILEAAVNGSVSAHTIQFGESPLARLHIHVRTAPGKIPAYDARDIERKLIKAARGWADQLQDALVAQCGEERGILLLNHYRTAFPASYRDQFEAETAASDIEIIEEALAGGDIGMSLYRPEDMPAHQLRFKVYSAGAPIPLSDVLPMLEHMGLKVNDERPHRLRPSDKSHALIMIHDFGLETRSGSPVDIGAVEDNFKELFSHVWAETVESDGFNALVLEAGLNWREVIALRAFCKYIRQAQIPFSQEYMEQTLVKNRHIARKIVDMFLLKFDTKQAKGVNSKIVGLRQQLAEALDAVASADEDRILRRFINVVESMLRTNFFQPGENGEPKPYMSFKLDSRNIDDLPLPKPWREIFVYSPRIEGIHLRFGKVARGGLRWSDRREDFRTEILGLVKAQQVKNAVIVPVGSKGGFVVKHPPMGGDREAFLNEGIACYKTLISGLLDITDNLKGDKVVPPKNVVRHDENDPYLVVAADKGTATFSDIANGVSTAYGFWLGDAFASGGSVGYDHKKMGITARGAWECVKRHFREIGKDIQKEDFTVVGVGDMSGDVFGNGMLLSKHIKLLGAFNHLHIFLDPDPDTAKSWAERKRLFNLPRSSWADYNKALISKGGGIFERSAKSIPLSPEIRKAFGVSQTAMAPSDLIKTLLTAGVDLLWFGGIGSYIKSSEEGHADAGDRSNDANRVNGNQVRAKAVGEGANLGMTQRGRVEYALKGGRINTDSIDNSAGVDCSDHEVNIKILIDAVIAKGGMKKAGRTALLESMTNEVGELCLSDNYLQSQAMTLSQSQGVHILDVQIRLMKLLEKEVDLNRTVEFLPDDETLAERQQTKQGLVRPELSVLLSYSKNWLYAELLESDVPDDAFLLGDLDEYFPTALQKKFSKEIPNHRLRREIIATVVTNNMINRVGETFVSRFIERTGMSPAEIVRAFIVTRHVFELDALWSEIESLDNKVPAAAQTAMLQDIVHLLDWATLWFLRNGDRPLDIGKHVDAYQEGVGTLAENLPKVLPDHYAEDLKTRAKPYVDQGVPEKLALRISGLVNLFSACDIVRLSQRRKLPVTHVGKLYFAVGTQFMLGRLRAAADKLDTQTHWQKLAAEALIEELYGHQLTLSNHVLDGVKNGTSPDKAVETWNKRHHDSVEQTKQLLSELWSAAVTDLSMVAVASRQLRALSDIAAR
ncbi:MAG: NAD-glutamate dehydrogenase [Rhodospirillales bacterium]